MVIFINTILFIGDTQDTNSYIHEIFSRVAAANTQHQFIYLFDRPFDKYVLSGSNITAVSIKPVSTKKIALRYWYDYKLTTILKKNKADVVFHADMLCSLRCKLPQVIVAADLSFFANPQFYKKSKLNFLKKMLPKYLDKAKNIITLSSHQQQQLEERYETAKGKVIIIPAAAGEHFKALNWQEKEVWKDKFTEGKEYFLYSGSIAASKNLMNILKAFSHFKKWQKSNMQLMIVGKVESGYEKFLEDIKLYKYRNDVKLLPSFDESELPGITASAYAFVYATFTEGFAMQVLQAMQSAVPVIVSEDSSLAATFGNAVIAASPNDHKAIAEQMILLYKDENLRNVLIATANERAEQISWNYSTAAIRQLILPEA
jgi:glycosyltransferase involved in cell wall biosynthesis